MTNETQGAIEALDKLKELLSLTNETDFWWHHDVDASDLTFAQP